MRKPLKASNFWHEPRESSLRWEGIIPALESAHAVIKAVQIARELGSSGVVLVNLSGRGDKDMNYAMELIGGGF